MGKAKDLSTPLYIMKSSHLKTKIEPTLEMYSWPIYRALNNVQHNIRIQTEGTSCGCYYLQLRVSRFCLQNSKRADFARIEEVKEQKTNSGWHFQAFLDES
jgi:hypothetical protein